MAVIASENADPAPLAAECAYLAGRIGAFTDAVAAFVRAQYPAARFEVLYPLDVNDTALNRLVNFPAAAWTAAKLACLKTESFGYTASRDLDKARISIGYPQAQGFAAGQASHLVGINEYTAPWEKERRLALAEGVESVVLFALDQMCLIGYGLPLPGGKGAARFLGK